MTRSMEQEQFATPDKTRPIWDRAGKPCPRATADSYPISGWCVCGQQISAADGPADWVHVVTRQGLCVR